LNIFLHFLGKTKVIWNLKGSNNSGPAWRS